MVDNWIKRFKFRDGKKKVCKDLLLVRTMAERAVIYVF